MGKVYEGIDGPLAAFIEAQRMFFVATAPLDGGGHVNLSPKGLDTFRILDRHTVAYLDYVGSGAETIAHLRENGRIVIMFCAFDGPPKIVRLHGRGEVIEPADEEYARLRQGFPPAASERAIIRVTIERTSDSCGYGVPRYTFDYNRKQLPDWCSRTGEAGLADYQRRKNQTSLDGLPALRWTDGVTPDSR